MPSSCTVPDCELKYNHSDDVSYHKYPLKKPDLLLQWIAFAGRGPDWIPNKWSAICSRHFKPSDFKDCIYRKNLISTAIPSVRIKHQTPIAELIAGKEESEFHHESHSETHEMETDPEDLSGGEESQLLDMTCRLCGIVFSKWCLGLLSDFQQHVTLIMKCLPFINLDLVQFPTKVCAKCLKVLNGFSTFHDNVVKAQNDLERKYNGLYEHYSANVPTVEPSKAMKIKQEPLMSIKEETVDTAVKIRDNMQEIAENTLIIKNPNITNDINKVLLFNKQPGEGQYSKQTRESKNCEILEIVNLYPPIVDITSATIREVQPYEITLPSSLSSFNPIAPQIFNLKTENTTEAEENYEDYTGYFQDFLAGFSAWEEHSYSKLPVQADDNKDEVFPSHQELEPSDSINLGNSGTVRVIHVELPPAPPTSLKYLCPLCAQHKFQSRRKLLKHRILLCSGRKTNPYRCLYCLQKFPSSFNRQSHLTTCRRRTFQRLLRCRRAKKVLQSRQMKKFESRTPTPDDAGSNGVPRPRRVARHHCKLCDRSYSRMYNLNRHMSSHRPVDQWNHKCGVCQRIFDKLFDLKKHFQLSKCMGGTDVDNNETNSVSLDECGAAEKPPSDRLLYVCSTCDKQFKSYNSLKVHESIHTGLKIFVCETCGKRFGGQVNLSQHRMTHVDVRQFACKLCPKVFKRTGGLNQHVKAFHMKIKPYQCTVCRRDFALKADMTRCRHSKLKEFT
ncbi:zinc finger protein 782-like [Malaya genurostris]|uniref:zinc finger protein 782-like n=1 Tax=Malaya genurostris TaxID=325434 RepID=UPI0026F3CC15|nr:zinc finger protein 782-like [Malaya genurostris]